MPCTLMSSPATFNPSQPAPTAASEDVRCHEALTTSTPRNIITSGSPKMSNRFSSPCRDQKATSKVKKKNF